jgi:hypothetical protein
MKKSIKLILLLSVIYLDVYGQSNSLNLLNEEKWKCEITFENHLGPFNTFLFFNYQNSVEFAAHSLTNADKRIFGNIKATLARILKKSPKKGIFIKITDGKVVSKFNVDSLYGTIHIPMVGNKNFKAVKLNDSIFGSILDSNEIIGHLNCIKTQSGFYMDYNGLNQRIIDTVKKYIYNPELLETRQWKRFVKKIDKLSDRVFDDVEYFLGFNLLSQKLSFSHFNLFIFSQSPGYTIRVR